MPSWAVGPGPMFHFGIPNWPIYDAKLWHMQISKLGRGESWQGNSSRSEYPSLFPLRLVPSSRLYLLDCIYPPRSNLLPLDHPCAQLLPKAGPEHIVQVSCDPSRALTAHTPAGFLNPPLSTSYGVSTEAHEGLLAWDLYLPEPPWYTLVCLTRAICWDGTIPRCKLVHWCLKDSGAKSAGEELLAWFQFLLQLLFCSHYAMAT